MWRTRAGYAGGTKVDPTYHSLGDHTECFQVDFDPAVISYRDLLDVFWQSHNSTRPAYSTQYASLVLAHDEDQLAAARASALVLERAVGHPVLTRIEPLTRFYPAEDYHQKYYLRSDRVLMRDFSRFYGANSKAFVDSTAAAKANGFVARDGTKALLESLIDELGLSDAGRAELATKVSRSRL